MMMLYMHINIPESFHLQANARWQVSQRGVGSRWFSVGESVEWRW
jgi:hypothetical protein